MGNSTQQNVRRQVALIGWGMKTSLGDSTAPEIEAVVEMLERKGLDMQIVAGNLQIQKALRRNEQGKVTKVDSMLDLEVRGDIAKQVKGMGCKTAIFFVSRSNQELQLVWGDLSIAGVEIWLVPIEGYNLQPMPCTMRYKGEVEIGSHPLEAGSWVKHQVAGVTAYRWKEPRWSFDELASTTFPFGSVIMWKASDYDECWTPEGKPLSPPEGVSYPHELDLTGVRFSEVPLRYIDYLVGQPWIYGEFAQRLRQYHAHPLIQEDLHRKFTPHTETVGGKGVPADRRNLESDTTGYWDNHDRYVSTMCQGRPQKDALVLLTPRDRFGGKLKGKAAYNKTLTDHVARRLEQLGYEDILEQPAWRWCQGTPWLFDEYAPEAKDGQLDPANLEPVLDLEEEPDFMRDPSKQRFSYAKEMDADIGEEVITEKSHRNAWYTALDLSEQLAQLAERARAAQTPEDWNPADVYGEKRSLLEEFRNITLQVTPLLLQMLGMGVREWLYQQAKEVLAEVRAAAQRCHEDAYLRGIRDVLEEHPSQLSTLIRTNLELALRVLREYPELDRPSDLISQCRAARKERATRFPEIYTKRGTRRVRCAHEKTAS